MELKLNIYNSSNKNEIDKVYVAETYDIMFGTIEDLMNVIDLNKLDDNMEIAKAVFKAFDLLKPFLKDIFQGVTDDELRRVKIKELIPVFVDVIKFSFNEFLGIAGEKN